MGVNGVNGVWVGPIWNCCCKIGGGDEVWLGVVPSSSDTRCVPADTTTLGGGAVGPVGGGAVGTLGGVGKVTVGCGVEMRAWDILEDVGAYEGVTLGDDTGVELVGVVRRDNISLSRLMARNCASPGCW